MHLSVLLVLTRVLELLVRSLLRLNRLSLNLLGLGRLWLNLLVLVLGL
jgi:hypothetical protein